MDQECYGMRRLAFSCKYVTGRKSGGKEYKLLLFEDPVKGVFIVRFYEFESYIFNVSQQDDLGDKVTTRTVPVDVFPGETIKIVAETAEAAVSFFEREYARLWNGMQVEKYIQRKTLEFENSCFRYGFSCEYGRYVEFFVDENNKYHADEYVISQATIEPDDSFRGNLFMENIAFRVKSCFSSDGEQYKNFSKRVEGEMRTVHEREEFDSCTWKRRLFLFSSKRRKSFHFLQKRQKKEKYVLIHECEYALPPLCGDPDYIVHARVFQNTGRGDEFCCFLMRLDHFFVESLKDGGLMQKVSKRILVGDVSMKYINGFRKTRAFGRRQGIVKLLKVMDEHIKYVCGDKR